MQFSECVDLFVSLSILTDSGQTIEVWDGRSKGPPRKEKFPEKEEVLKVIQSKLE